MKARNLGFWSNDLFALNTYKLVINKETQHNCCVSEVARRGVEPLFPG